MYPLYPIWVGEIYHTHANRWGATDCGFEDRKISGYNTVSIVSGFFVSKQGSPFFISKIFRGFYVAELCGGLNCAVKILVYPHGYALSI